MNLHPETATLILAAGAATRMGQPKQLLAFQGRPLLHHVVDQAVAAQTELIAVVLGAYSDQIEPVLKPFPQLLVVPNPNWKAGIGKSLSVGLQALLKVNSSLKQVLVLLADQPLMPHTHLQELLNPHSHPGFWVVASQYDDTIGVPVVFRKPAFEHLLGLQEDKGAKAILTTLSGLVATVHLPEGFQDIDTPEQYQNLLNKK